MTLTLSLLALTFAISFVVMLVNLASAPEGYEDDAGFHTGKPAGQNFYNSVSANQPQAIPVYVTVPVRQVAA
jgi:hypothetical protein